MPSKSSTPITVRLPNELVAAIQAEVEQLELSRSEIVTRRLRRSFSRAQESKNLVEIGHDSSGLTFHDSEDDEE